MSLPPLHLPDFPTVGPTGERDNLERLYIVQSALIPPDRVLRMAVTHDDGCPCAKGTRPTAACTCDTVDVTLRLADARAS